MIIFAFYPNHNLSRTGSLGSLGSLLWLMWLLAFNFGYHRGSAISHSQLHQPGNLSRLFFVLIHQFSASPLRDVIYSYY